MPRARTLSLNEGHNRYSLKKGRKKLGELQVYLIDNNVLIKIDRHNGSEVGITTMSLEELNGD